MGDPTQPLDPDAVTGSEDEQPAPPVISPWESVFIRWIAAQIPGGLNYLLHITHLDVKWHITEITDNGVLQVLYFLLGVIGAYKILRQRVKSGLDPANKNVPAIKLPNIATKLLK